MTDSSTTILTGHPPDISEVIGIFRRCKRCGQYRSLGYFNKGIRRLGRVCLDCYKGVHRIGRKGINVGERRGYVLTDEGRALLAQEVAA